MATPEKRIAAAEMKMSRREQEGVLDDKSSIFISLLTRVRLHSETTWLPKLGECYAPHVVARSRYIWFLNPTDPSGRLLKGRAMKINIMAVIHKMVAIRWAGIYSLSGWGVLSKSQSFLKVKKKKKGQSTKDATFSCLGRAWSRTDVFIISYWKAKSSLHPSEG